jgi:hypothetical protein
MAEEITVHPFDPAKNGDFLIAVHEAHFPGVDSAAKRQSYVEWLLSNPVPGSIYLAAHVDGTFASFLGFIAREVVGFGRVFRGALAFGAMTMPAFSGRNLYRRLAHAGWEEARRRGFDFALGYTNRRYVLDMELKMGWSALGASPVMALPLDGRAVFRKALPQIGFLALMAAPVGWLAEGRAVRRADRAAAIDCEIRATDKFSPECDELTRRMQTDSKLAFAKDRRTLDWLYLSPHNPFKYDVVEARRGGQLVGFAVGRRMEMLELEGYGFLDLISAPDHDDVLAPLAAKLTLAALPNRPQIIACLTTRGHTSHTALKTLGFVDSRQSFMLIYRPLRDGLPEALQVPEHWANFWGNNDTV